MNHRHPDKYKNYAELSANHIEGTDYEIETYRSQVSDILIAIPHGGYIEYGATPVGIAIANAGHHSWYSFSGYMKKSNFDLHITSPHFDEPQFAEFAKGAKRIVGVHGYGFHGGEIYDNVLIGGGDEPMRSELISRLQYCGYDAPDFSDDTPYKGIHPENICNRGKLPGIQIELSQAFRKRLLDNPDTLEDFAQIVNEIICK